MTIRLDLSRVCIETATKQAYNRHLNRYFKAAPSEKEGLEADIETLFQFIKSADFQFLRTHYTELRGGTRAEIEINRSNNGYITLLCDQTPLEIFSPSE